MQTGAARFLATRAGRAVDRVVVALLAADKAQMGDVFYNSVGARADALIDQWYRQAKEQT